MPHPNLVPVSPSSSRKYQSNGIDGSPSKWRSSPLTCKVTILSSTSEMKLRPQDGIDREQVIRNWCCGTGGYGRIERPGASAFPRRSDVSPSPPLRDTKKKSRERKTM